MAITAFLTDSTLCIGCKACEVACKEWNNVAEDGLQWSGFSYDRQKVGLKPACAKACPTESIKFGEIEQLRGEAEKRVASLVGRGMKDVQFYDASDSSVGGTHAMFIVRGDPRSYNLPPKPEVPTVYLKKAWRSSALGALLVLGGTIAAFLADGNRNRR